MKKALTLLAFTACFIANTNSALAQSGDEYHPFLSDTFHIGTGIFYPTKTLTLRVDGSTPEDEIELDEALKLDESEATGNLNFRWRFGEKWSFWGQYWKVQSDGGAVLEEDIEWGNVVFQEGTFANGGMDISVARLFFGRTFYTRPGHEFGLGGGLHWMEMGAYLEGQILTSIGDTEFYRGNVSADFPLPNIGGWYHFSWHPKWMFQARIDWLKATVGDYSGGLWNAQAGVNWQFSKRLGLGLSYQGFILDVDVDKGNWHGKAEADQHGPILALTASW